MNDKRRVIQLISVTNTQDSIGQIVSTESSTDVICTLRNVSLSEWTNAGQLGLSAEYQAVMWSTEYSGQELVEIDSERYKVYRTYETDRHIELYLERMVGH